MHRMSQDGGGGFNMTIEEVQRLNQMIYEIAAFNQRQEHAFQVLMQFYVDSHLLFNRSRTWEEILQMDARADGYRERGYFVFFTCAQQREMQDMAYLIANPGSLAFYELVNGRRRIATIDVTDAVNAALIPTILEALRLRAEFANALIVSSGGIQIDMRTFRHSIVPPVINPLGGARQLHYNVMTWFYNQVDHERPWDIKSPEMWLETIGTEFPGEGVFVSFRDMVMTPEELGNFTFGYIGAALGLPLPVLLGGSVYAAHTGDALGSFGQIVNEFAGDWPLIFGGFRAFDESRYIP
jgi:hypothetical protein